MTRTLDLLSQASRRMPPWLERPVVRVAAEGFYWLAKEKRNAALQNHHVVSSFAGSDVPNRLSPRQTVRRAFRVQVANYLEMFRSPGFCERSLLKRISMDGLELLDEAMRAGRGAVLLGPHMGDWEMSGLALAERGYDLTVVTGVQMNRTLTGGLRSFKEDRGIDVVTPQDSYRELFRKLSRGGVVALLLDGDVFDKGIPVRFFGHHALFPTGPVRLARRAGAPLLLAYSVRNPDGTVQFRIFDRLEPPSGCAESVMPRVVRRIEPVIASHLDQWCATKRIWEFQGGAR